MVSDLPSLGAFYRSKQGHGCRVAGGVGAELIHWVSLETLVEARHLPGLKLEKETCRVGKNSKRRLVKHCNG